VAYIAVEEKDFIKRNVIFVVGIHVLKNETTVFSQVPAIISLCLL